jgi:hypothetical protein
MLLVRSSIRTNYCWSSLVNCAAVNCSSSEYSQKQTCLLLSFIQSSGLGSPCAADGPAAGQWIRAYWGDNELCGIGFLPVLFPGLMTELLCCDSDGCNHPGAVPSPLQCFTTASAITGGYCAGRTFVYRICSSKQKEVDKVADYVNTVQPPLFPQFVLHVLFVRPAPSFSVDRIFHPSPWTEFGAAYAISSGSGARGLTAPETQLMLIPSDNDPLAASVNDRS